MQTSQNSVEQSPAVTLGAESAPLLAVDTDKVSDDEFPTFSVADNGNGSPSKTPVSQLSRNVPDVEMLAVKPRLCGPVESVPKVSFILGE